MRFRGSVEGVVLVAVAFGDDGNCSIKGRRPLDYLEYANSLDKILQFTTETPNGNEYLAFLDLNININDAGKK